MSLRFTAILTILALLGLADATYLTILHYQNAIPPCSIAHGCETVLTSKYATVLGIPIALLGVFYYFAVFIAMLLFAQTKKTIWVILTCVATSITFVIAIILIYIQAFILHAFCQYCLASEFIDTLLMVFAWILLNTKNNSSKNNVAQ